MFSFLCYLSVLLTFYPQSFLYSSIANLLKGKAPSRLQKYAISKERNKVRREQYKRKKVVAAYAKTQTLPQNFFYYAPTIPRDNLQPTPSYIGLRISSNIPMLEADLPKPKEPNLEESYLLQQDQVSLATTPRDTQFEEERAALQAAKKETNLVLDKENTTITQYL